MDYKLFLVFFNILLASGQETKRNSRIRFPNEQVSQYHNVGPQIFESESQAVPIIIGAGGNGLVNGPHYTLPKVPSDTNPFGQINTKGYAEGIIIPHTSFHHSQNQQEFHQTVPPPIRVPLGLPQSFVMYRQQLANQGNRPNSQQHQIQQQQQPERHRFGVPPPRLPYNQLKQLYPNQHAHHEIYASGMTLTKDPLKKPDVAMYRYSIVTNHGKPRPSQPDEFEMEISHGVPDELTTGFPSPPKPNPHQNNNYKLKNTQKPKATNQKLKDSDKFSAFSDFESGIPDWQVKGSFQDIPQSDEFPGSKKKPGSGPNLDKYSFPQFDSMKDDFSSFDDFPEFPPFPTQSTKRFSPHRHPGFPNGAAKPHKSHNTPTQVPQKPQKGPQKFPPSFETIKSIELAGGEVFSEENFSTNFNFNQKPFKKQEKPQTNFHGNPQKLHHQEFFLKSQYKKIQKPTNNQDEKYSFNIPQRPDRVKKPQKQQQNVDTYDFPTPRPQRKQHKQPQFEELPPINYNFEFDKPQNNKNIFESAQGNSNFGSDWIPINAPDGVVPARSYDIPAPDLSKSSYDEKQTYEREGDWPEDEDDEEESFRFASPETVYGVQKGSKRHSGEEVVSATFRVKQ